MKSPLSSILLDIGGTYIKSALLVEGKGSPQNIKHFGVPEFVKDKPYRAVIPTAEFLAVVDRAIQVQKQMATNVNHIYVSGQMGGYVIEQSGDFEIVSWQDQRSLEPQYERERNELELWLKASSTFKETGSELRPGLPFFSLAITKPYAVQEKMVTSFRSVISFVTSYLTNFETNEMHITDAAASGFYNLRSKCWDKELYSKLDNSMILPLVHSEVTKIGYSSKFLLEVFSGVGDQQASLLGCGIEPGEIVVNIGTGGQVAGLQETSQPKGVFQLRPYFDGKEIRTITHLPSGRALNAFVEFCFPGDRQFNKYREFERSCRTPDMTSEIDLVNFIETLKHLRADGHQMSPDSISSKFFGSLIRSYKDALSVLNLKGKLLFAGGVGQKIRMISRELSRATGREFSVSNVQETTLEGLAKIAKIHR